MCRFPGSALLALLLVLPLAGPAAAQGTISFGQDRVGTAGPWSGGGAAQPAPPDPAPPDPVPAAPAAGGSATADAQSIAQDVVVTIFYHELGHALIDILKPPVLGLEEDAADILSVLMINELWDEAASEQKLRATAAFWGASMAEQAASGEMFLNYGVHSPDDRRYFTYVCLWYGASPQTREAVAIELGLPEDRAVTCPEEFDLANTSWGVYLDEIYAAGAGKTLVWTGPDPATDPFAAVLKEEVDYLNTLLSLPRDLTITYGPCGEANAFYDPSVTGVTMCSELAEWARESIGP